MSLKSLILFLLFLSTIDLFSQSKTGEVKKFNSYIEFLNFLEENNQPFEYNEIDEIKDLGTLFFVDHYSHKVVEWSQKEDFVILYHSTEEFFRRNNELINIESIVQTYVVKKKRNAFFKDKEIIRNLSKDEVYYYKIIEKKLGINKINTDTSFDSINLKYSEYKMSGQNIDEIFLPILFICGNKLLSKYGGEWTSTLKLYYFGMEYYMPELLINGRKINISSLVSSEIHSQDKFYIDLEAIIKKIEPFANGKIIYKID